MSEEQIIDDITKPLYDYFTIREVSDATGGAITPAQIYSFISRDMIEVYPGTKLVHKDEAIRFIFDHLSKNPEAEERFYGYINNS
jgi:hypothetical protein